MKKLTVKERHRIKMRAVSRAKTRLVNLYPNVYRKLYAEELERVNQKVSK